MKKLKTRDHWKASNVEYYYTENREPYATSYGWWPFVSTIDAMDEEGNTRRLTVFNHGVYSMSTCRHQSKVHALMDELEEPIHVYLDSQTGLGGVGNIMTAFQDTIDSLTAKIEKAQRLSKTGRIVNRDGYRQETADLVGTKAVVEVTYEDFKRYWDNYSGEVA